MWFSVRAIASKMAHPSLGIAHSLLPRIVVSIRVPSISWCHSRSTSSLWSIIHIFLQRFWTVCLKAQISVRIHIKVWISFLDYEIRNQPVFSGEIHISIGLVGGIHNLAVKRALCIVRFQGNRQTLGPQQEKRDISNIDETISHEPCSSTAQSVCLLLANFSHPK